ncbi:F-box/kelch-repeat protein At3g06240-like isoform X1 [Papaver somniferum]|uniref:F-box/kelch-repeat protein At3g06240-like isoform X1 n=1 Tax=Papaver somniferum TaxID=3469 RepID=UPI000E6F906F|nr:F-box/kelch-repeat protein At3g06240-like isoform X1 [Papaver somniferum]XP_026439132.1 F-box/kelch-repeat protein At3g06240-like isoform X1 [Papaver somniferum]
MKIIKDLDMDHFNSLPLEFASEILARAPAKSVLECKSVCRNWRKIVDTVMNDPLFSFFQKHLYHVNHPSAAAEDSGMLSFLAYTSSGFQFFEYDQNLELTIPLGRTREISSTIDFGGRHIGSCNGLICLSPHQPKGLVCICNPFIQEYVLLPDIRMGRFDDYHEFNVWSIGFGYVAATNEYKVVVTFVSKSSMLKVHIYTLDSGNGWRNLGKFSLNKFAPCDLVHGSFANGAIYWIGRNVNKIVTFDLIEEKFCQHLALPPLSRRQKKLHQKLGVLDGLLYIAIDTEDKYFDIRLLKKKNDNGVKKEGERHQSFEWSKEYRVDNELLAVTKNGGVLTYNDDEGYVYLYDTEASTSKELVEFEDEFLQVFPHKNTFVSLKELKEEDTQKMKPVKRKQESLITFKQLQEDANPD